MASYELAIVGGGPAGAAAAIYAARKNLKTIFITDEWGGQSNVSSDIHNWIGTPSLSGADLAKRLKEHVESYKGEFLEIKTPTRVVAMKAGDPITLSLKDGSTIEAKTLLVAAGARRRKLEVPGAAEYDQKGLTYCASCDGPLFDGKDVVVIGGGNAGFDSALQLLAYCKSVTLIHRNDSFKADAISVKAATANPKFRAILNAEPTAVLGEQFVTGLTYKDISTGKEEKLAVEGVFVEIGLLPNSEWLNGSLEMNEIKQIKVDAKTQRTSVQGIWAAGDITDGLYHQNNIAAGDAVKALEDIYMALRRS